MNGSESQKSVDNSMSRFEGHSGVLNEGLDPTMRLLPYTTPALLCRQDRPLPIEARAVVWTPAQSKIFDENLVSTGYNNLL